MGNIRLRFASFRQKFHYWSMGFHSLRLRSLLLLAPLTACAWAGVIEDVRIALSQQNFSAAESELNSYRSQRGITGEYLGAYSRMARPALASRQNDQPAAYARQPQSSRMDQLTLRAS